MRTSTIVAAAAAITAAAVLHAPAARAGMLMGNYEDHTTRDTGHSWLWSIRPCQVDSPSCVHVFATPRPNGQAVSWDGDAHLANGRYTMVVDVPDGVRCLVYFRPSHDVYSWDAVTLEGSVDSTFDRGCGDDPGGSASWPMALVRF